MTDSRFDPPQDPAAGSPAGGDAAANRQRLEWELKRIRSEASAARLDARAAEIEIELRKLDGDLRSSDVEFGNDHGFDGRADSVEVQEHDAPIQRHDKPSLPSPRSRQTPAERSLKSWDEVREWMNLAGFPANTHRGVTAQPLNESSASDDHASDLSKVNRGEPSPNETPRQTTLTPIGQTQRIDAGHREPRAPRMLAPRIEPDSKLGPSDGSEGETDSENGLELESAFQDEILRIDRGHDDASESVALPADSELEISEDDETASRRRSPMALAISAAVHVAVFVILGLIGFQTHVPKDQVALTASTTETSMAEFETMSVEMVEPTTEPVEETEPTETDFEYELSPVGEMAAPKMSAPSPPSFAKAMKAMSASSSSAKMMSELKTDSKANIRFCGVDGGGNHFVYLLDSSGSMGEGFESARRELLQSIDALTPKQRFYVVFYDKEPDFMRITNPNADEPFSVSATAENKAAVRRWAMTVSQDRGWAPYEPAEFALKKLRPDVIFLLSDGEFPQKFEDMLKEDNVVENLFGDRKPVSIIHTIAYHSKEGESRMRRIAKQHGGQFRYVPKP